MGRKVRSDTGVSSQRSVCLPGQGTSAELKTNVSERKRVRPEKQRQQQLVVFSVLCQPEVACSVELGDRTVEGCVRNKSSQLA